jgi:hypothetical protein
MKAYITYITADNGTGDYWKVWIGMAPSEEVITKQVRGLVDALNRFEQLHNNDPLKWIVQTIKPFDNFATVLTGGQAEIARWYYRYTTRDTVKPATVEDSVAFMHEQDIYPESSIDDLESYCPECNSFDHVTQLGSLDIVEGKVVNPLICKNCETCWDDIYEKVGVNNVEPGEVSPQEGNSSNDITEQSWADFVEEQGLGWVRELLDEVAVEPENDNETHESMWTALEHCYDLQGWDKDELTN